MSDPGRVQRLLGGAGLAWLVDRWAAALGRDGRVPGAVSLADPSPAQREAVAGLLGRRTARGARLVVRTDAVSEVLRGAGAADDVAAAVELLRGPVEDRSASAAATTRRWDEVLAPLDELAARRPALAVGVAEVRGAQGVRRVARGDPSEGRRLVAAVVAVLAALPAGGVPRAVLAARVLGDAHALDDDRPVAGLVLRALAAGVAAPADTAGRRRGWADAGVLDGELGGPVLALGLPGDPATVAGRLLGVAADAGEPVHLTARQLLRAPPELHVRGAGVFVCENPSVVAAAADALGPRCEPLVCVGGFPSVAATALLGGCAAAGARLAYHGDFDWNGLRIAGGVLRRFGATPWRLSTADYLATADRGGPLTGRPTTAAWDADLAPALTRRARRVEEELVLDDLLADLAS